LECSKGTFTDGKQEQHVIPVWQGDARNVCVVWRDENYDPASPSFWYARVQETESPRWSALMCRRTGRCDEFPDADQMIIERAWSSPIWSMPR